VLPALTGDDLIARASESKAGSSQIGAIELELAAIFLFGFRTPG
jgi:hypothetical protein